MKRYIRSSVNKPLSAEQKEMRKASERNNQELAYDMLNQLSESKKIQLDKFLSRNEALTSTYGCSFGNLRVYKEGWYLTLDGTRSAFSVWYTDVDGELVEGRKPNESKLHFLYEQDLRFNGVDWYEMVKANSAVTSTTEMNPDPLTGWPDSHWWLSIDRAKNTEAAEILEPIEDPVLNELGVYVVKYVDEMSLLDARDDYEINSMSWDDYLNQELELASTCRSSKEFQGKFRKWIWELMDKG